MISSTSTSGGRPASTTITGSPGSGSSRVSNWLCEQGGRHVLVMAVAHPAGDQRLRALEIDEADVGPRGENPGAVGALQGRAGQHPRAARRSPGFEFVSDSIQPRRAVGVVERNAFAHLFDIRRRMQAVALHHLPAEPLGETCGHRGFPAAGDAHDHQRTSLGRRCGFAHCRVSRARRSLRIVTWRLGAPADRPPAPGSARSGQAPRHRRKCRSSSTTPATRKAAENEFVSPTMTPVTAGATAPIRLLKKFITPPIVPVPPRGAISDGIDHPTGAAAASPLSAIEIQTDRPERGGRHGGAEDGEAQHHPADEHRLAHDRLVVAASDHPVDQPAADDEIGDGGEKPRDRRVAGGLDDAHVHRRDKVAGQPGEEEIEGVAIGGEADGQPPYLAVLEQVAEHPERTGLGRPLRRRAALTNIGPLLAAEFGVRARVAIDDPVGDEIGEAQDRRQPEAPAPAERHDSDGHQGHADDIGEFRRRVEDGRRGCAFAAREPVAGRLGVGRKRRRLGDAEQDPRCEDRAEAGGEGDEARRHAPEERADPAHRHDAEAVEHHADRHLQDGVGPEEGAEQEPDVGRSEPEFLLELRRGDRDVHPVEVIDENADAEQDADRPPAASDGGSSWHSAARRRLPCLQWTFPVPP